MGRPDQQGAEELERRLIETAARLFADQGYAATSVDQVAAAAGASKQTIYRRYPSKEHLFRAVVGEHMLGLAVEAWTRRMAALTAAAEAESVGPLEVLRRIGRNTLDFMLEPDSIRLQRIMITEDKRSELTIQQLQNGALIFEEVLGRQLKAAAAAGELPPGAEGQGEAVLISMIVGWCHKQSLLLGVPVDAKTRDAFFDCAWRIFLSGVTGAG
jgi:AcrR family transcriptional regulator